MGVAGLTTPVKQIAHGQHACGLFDCDAQQEELLVDFVQAGLEAGEQVWCFADAHSPQQMVELLRGSFRVEEPIARGQLAIHAASESYLREQRFDPETMIARLHEAIDTALAAGYRGFRVTGEMSWATGGVLGAERLEAYEARVGEVFAQRPALGLCQYDRRRFEPARAERIAALHPQRARTSVVSPDGLLRVVQPGDGGVRLVGEIDLTNAELLADALGDACRDGDGDARDGAGDGAIHLDLRRLRFLDLGGARRLARFAQTLAPERRLVLHEPPGGARRVIELLPHEFQLLEVAV